MIQLQPGMSSFKPRGGRKADFIRLHLGDLCVVSETP
jgi:hypothetical protein